MGDYYKIKKILLILLIVSVIFRIINQTKVFAAEAVEVTPVWNDGDYTYQADNQYLTLRQNQLDTQERFINFLYDMYSWGSSQYIANTRSTLQNIKTVLISTNLSNGNANGGVNTRFIWFGAVTTQVNNTNDYGYCYQIMTIGTMNNITYADATLNSGYKILSVPFYSFTRNNTRALKYVNVYNGTTYSVTDGTALVPVAEVGCYSTRWLDVFQLYGVIKDDEDYNNTLANIAGSVDELEGYAYSSAYYAR